jgi:hypothetical protein
MSGPVIRRPAVESPSVLDSSMERAIKALARFIGGDDPNSQVLGMLNPTEVAAGPVAKAIEALAKRLKPIKAYHGSPHDFDKFSLDKIGTGEGAQAYGHGLYFAENEKVAKAYRDDLGLKVPAIDGRPTATPAEGMAHTIMSRLPKNATVADAHRIVDEWTEAGVFRGKNEGRSAMDVKEALAANFGKPLSTSTQGKMYEVNIHADPDDFLDWDAPLSQQSEKVKQALDKHTDLTMEDRAQLKPRSIVPSTDMGSKTWRERGLAGIKYLDGNSRGAKEGTRNYVVFDEKLIEIVKKYGIAGAVSAGLINESQAQQLKEQGYQ